MKWVYDDGGRSAAGYKGSVGDCGTRAVAIAAEQPYKLVYDALKEHAQAERPRKGRKRSSVRDGTAVATMKRYVEGELGWYWNPTMGIGTGCTVHLNASELPSGPLVARVSKHYCAVVDGVIHDNHDPSREGARCVYGFWSPYKWANSNGWHRIEG